MVVDTYNNSGEYHMKNGNPNIIGKSEQIKIFGTQAGVKYC